MDDWWGQVKDFFADYWIEFKEVIYDIAVSIFDGILDAIAYIVSAIPMPDFLTQFTLSDYIGSEVAYLLTMSGFNTALGIIASAYLFRFIRRISTLGIW